MKYSNIVKSFKKIIANCDKREAELDLQIGRDQELILTLQESVKTNDAEIAQVAALRTNVKKMMGEA